MIKWGADGIRLGRRSDDDSAGASGDSPRLQARNLEKALQIAGGCKTTADELYEQFLDELLASVIRIRAMVHSDNYENLRSELHRLRGAAAMCAAESILAAVDDLREAARNQDAHRVLHFFVVLQDRAHDLLSGDSD